MDRPRFRFTVGRLMVAVAVVGVFLFALNYRYNNGSVDRSLTGLQFRKFVTGDASRRKLAVENLSGIEPDDLARVVSLLEAAARDVDWEVRVAAVQSVGLASGRCMHSSKIPVMEDVDRSILILVRALADANGEVRLAAANALGQLAECLQSPLRGLTSLEIKSSLDKCGQAARSLLRLMSDPDPTIRMAAIGTFSRIAVVNPKGPEALLRIMKEDPVPAVRAAAIGALAWGWPDEPGLFHVMITRLKEVSSQEERSAIGWSLGSLPVAITEPVGPLIEALSTDNWVFPTTLPAALVKMGLAARPALPSLAKIAAREIQDPRGSALRAAEAIVSIDRQSTEAGDLLEPLLTLLENSTDAFVRQQAARVLAKYGPAAAPALPILRRLLKNESAELRLKAAGFLGSLGVLGEPACADLEALSQTDSDANVRASAKTAVSFIRVECGVW